MFYGDFFSNVGTTVSLTILSGTRFGASSSFLSPLFILITDLGLSLYLLAFASFRFSKAVLASNDLISGFLISIGESGNSIASAS